MDVLFCLKVDERSGESRIERDDFFRVVEFDILLFFVQFISFVKRKANSTIELQNCKGHKKT